MNTTLAMELVQRAAPVSDEAIARLDLDDALDELLARVTAQPRGSEQGNRTELVPIPRSPRMRAAVTGLAVTAAIGAFAVTPVGAALRDLGGDLIDYFDADNPPEQPLDISANVPPWLRLDDQFDQRVIARAGPYSLYLSRDAAGDYNFGLDGSVGLGDSRAGWEQRFADNSAVILGPGTKPDHAGRLPLYGVTSSEVDRVELRYADGSTASAPANTGGFVLLFDPDRDPQQLVVLAADGSALQTLPAHRYGSSGREGHGHRHPHIVNPPDAIDLG